MNYTAQERLSSCKVLKASFTKVSEECQCQGVCHDHLHTGNASVVFLKYTQKNLPAHAHKNCIKFEITWIRI